MRKHFNNLDCSYPRGRIDVDLQFSFMSERIFSPLLLNKKKQKTYSHTHTNGLRAQKSPQTAK